MKRILLPLGNSYNFALCTVSSTEYSCRNPETSKTFFLQFVDSNPCRKQTPVIPEWGSLLKDNHIADVDHCKKEINHAEYQEYLRKKYRVSRKYKESHNIWIWIASSSLILILAFTAVYNHLKSENIENLFYRNYKAPLLTEVINYKNQIADENFKLSSFYFQRGDYLNAATYFDQIPSVSTGFYAAQFLSGICMMENKKFLEAIEKMDISSKNPTLLPYIQWYTGLCNLKLGRFRAAIYYFNQLNNSNHFLKKNAAKILKELETLH